VDAGTRDPVNATTLASLNVSVNGCNLIINNEHWVTRRYEVVNHTAGSAELDYDNAGSRLQTHCQSYSTDIALSRYLIDGCMAVFDAPGEWAYDEGHLVVRLPEGVDPLTANDTRISGKVQTCVAPATRCRSLLPLLGRRMRCAPCHTLDLATRLILPPA
jgi:hypothetical protein